MKYNINPLAELIQGIFDMSNGPTQEKIDIL